MGYKVEIFRPDNKDDIFMYINDKLWMWDIPEERMDQKCIADQCRGTVLVAGYGLGLVQKYLSENPKVVDVLTVEISPEVVAKARELYGQIYGEVVIDDFYKYWTVELFDSVVGDTWIDQSLRDIEAFRKFKQKAAELVKPDGIITGWGYDYMEWLEKDV